MHKQLYFSKNRQQKVEHLINPKNSLPTAWIKMPMAGSSTCLGCHGLEMLLLSFVYLPGTMILAPLFFADWWVPSGRVRTQGASA